MFHEILVPFNGSEDTIRALGVGAGLAQASSRPLRILAYSSEADVPIHSHALLDMVETISSRHDLSPQITTIASARYLGEDIIAESSRRPGSVLCLPSEGLGRKALLTGSLTTSILSEVVGPVVLVGPECEGEIATLSGPLVVALDGSVESERIIDVAHEWVQDFHLLVEVVTVIDPKATDAMASAIATGDVHESSYVAHVVNDSVLADDGATFEILHGKPVAEILREADVRHAAMIAIASHVPKGVDRLLHGSVLDEVVRSSPVPVLALNRNLVPATGPVGQ